MILKSTDGGLSWFSLTSGTTEHLTDIQFYDADIGYAVGYGGTILKTTDAGSSWTSLSSDILNDLKSVDFINAFTGYTVGDRKIFKTTDGGLSWEDKSFPVPEHFHLNTVEFVDANTGWIGFGSVLTHQGKIFKTTDGGNTWNLQYSGFEEKVTANYKANHSLDNQWGIRSIK